MACWVEGFHLGTGFQQVVNQVKGRCLPDVVGIGLESEAPNGDGLAAEVFAKACLYFGCQAVFLQPVHLHDRF